jgi:Zn-dependent protease with chaperone function
VEYNVFRRNGNMTYSVRKSENILFAIKIIATVGIIVGIIFSLPKIGEHSVYIITVIVYVLLILLYFWFYKVYLVAYLKGNGICVSGNQFRDIFEIYCDMAKSLGLKKIPPLFILQQGGLLNAFAIRFSGKNYIAIYSDIFSIYKSDVEAVKFVLAHELGHIKRKHNQKRFWTFPSSIIPFLTAAYSRACEYTCDNIGSSSISDESAKLHGLLLLAGGKEIYREIDINNYIETAAKNRSFVVMFINLFIFHPYLPKRIENLKGNKIEV